MGVPLHAAGFSSQIRDANGRTTLFEISDQDIAGDPSFYGYLNSRGHFIIMKQDLSAGTFRYFAGKGLVNTYSTIWTNRSVANLAIIDASFVYTTFDKILFVP